MLNLQESIIKNVLSDSIIVDPDDGEYFVNYMQYANMASIIQNWPPEGHDKIMLAMIDRIVKEKHANKNNEKVFAKYHWVQKYLHAWFMKSNLQNASKYIEMLEKT